MKLNGTNVKTEVKGNYEFMAVENSYLYYDLSTYGTNGYSKKIYRKKIGSSISKVVQSGVYDAAVKGNTLYYIKRKDTNYVGKTVVYSKNLSNNKVTKINTGTGYRSISTCGKWLYLSKNLNETYNSQALVMNSSGKKVKKLQKWFSS
jgi:hypothetical protein